MKLTPKELLKLQKEIQEKAELDGYERSRSFFKKKISDMEKTIDELMYSLENKDKEIERLKCNDALATLQEQNQPFSGVADMTVTFEDFDIEKIKENMTGEDGIIQKKCILILKGSGVPVYGLLSFLKSDNKLEISRFDGINNFIETEYIEDIAKIGILEKDLI